MNASWLDRLVRYCLVAIALVCVASVAQAQNGKGNGGGGGGGSGGTAAGTIYFSNYVSYENRTIWSMTRSGGEKTQLPLNTWHEPSHQLYGGQRWFLGVYETPGEFYDDGRQRKDIYAVRADGGIIVRLTSDPDIEAMWGGWLPGDQRIYYAGVTWSSGQPVAAGVYITEIQFSGGIAVGLAAQDPLPTFDTGMVYVWDPSFPEEPPYVPAIWFNLTWSPDGSKFIYVTHAPNGWSIQPGMLVVEWATGSVTTLLPNHHIRYPDWSPAGNLIVFVSGNNLQTVAPNGSGLKTIVKYTPNRYPSGPKFSPSGDEIIYAWICSSCWGFESDVYRANSSGKQASNLTTNFAGSAWPVGWR